MKYFNIVAVILFETLMFFHPAGAQEHHISLEGIHAPVEIITDIWGIPHIYAANEEDLFFAQGFYAAKDRLFQFEIWRRQATGTIAEILGERELQRDIGARLFSFRGNIQREMNYYHPSGELIITSYVRGVNAFIDHILQDPDKLPIEFSLLGIRPEKWTPEVVISRHQGLLGNINQELSIARAVSVIGDSRVKELSWFHPKDPDLNLDESINPDLLFDDILGLYNAFRRPLIFKPEDIIADAKNDYKKYSDLASTDANSEINWKKDEYLDIGSNNWVVSGKHTESGFPIMANDPHRRQSVPSLRYMSHLVAPGWDVIGGGEPEIPGVSIGHNRDGAWGLTVYGTDAEDLYVYQLHPEDHDQYLYKGSWETMKIIRDTINIKGRNPEVVDLRYTRHGPVTLVDEEHHVAYAVRCGWLEIGGSPYLASLRMDQARNFEEFRQACNYSHIPGENMVWADKNGNIGWQSVGIAPIRRNWSGLVPVPGNGDFEWDGYLPIIAKPWVYNPENGIINTSNENVTPLDYELWDAIGFSWSDPYRGNRVWEVLNSGRRHSLIEMARLQTDYLSIPARQIIPLINELAFDDPLVMRAHDLLKAWDFQMTKNSVAAGIYNEFERKLREDVSAMMIPEEAEPYLNVQMKRIIEWLVMPGTEFGADPLTGRDSILYQAFESCIERLKNKLGDQMDSWQFGQNNYKHIYLKHPLSNAVNEEVRKTLDVGPLPRGGNSFTVNNTSSSDNQVSGGSFRMIVDTGNWDHSIGTNNPGQNGNPAHPQYKNLFELWGKDQYFPIFYSREKVESVRFETWHLLPK